MEKTFREVIRDIKLGEVWVSMYKRILCFDGEIRIEKNDKMTKDVTEFVFNDYSKYKLAHKEYSFSEAWNAMYEGKTIQSKVSKIRFKKIINNERDIYVIPYEDDDKRVYTMDCLAVREINNPWYILD